MSISKTRHKLVDVARDLFAKKGLEATTMNDIATYSGKGRRTLYTYFRSKEEIYYAVIESELERLSEEMDRVAQLELSPIEKVVKIIYTHLDLIKEAVARNGSLRAEFFRNITTVERVRRAFDFEEKMILRRVLREGQEKGIFKIDSINLTADIIHYAAKGIEVAYIYDRIGEGVSHEDSFAIVERLVGRALGMQEDNR